MIKYINYHIHQVGQAKIFSIQFSKYFVNFFTFSIQSYFQAHDVEQRKMRAAHEMGTGTFLLLINYISFKRKQFCKNRIIYSSILLFRYNLRIYYSFDEYFLFSSMGKENEQFVFNMDGLSKNKILNEFKKIVNKGTISKLSVFVKYKHFSSSEQNENSDEEDDQVFEDIIRKSVMLSSSHNKKSILQQAIENYEESDFDSAINKLQKMKAELETKFKEKVQSQQETEKYSSVTFYLGNCYFRKQKYEEAIENFSKEPGNNIQQKGQRMNNLGICFAITKQNQLSLKAFNEAIKCYACFPNTDCSGLFHNIGLVYKKSAMYRQAEQYLQRSLQERRQKSPDNEQLLCQTYYDLGICQRKQQEYANSLKSFSFAQSLAKKDKLSNILRQIATVYELQERWDEALTYYEKLSDECQNQGICQGYIYERVARVHEKKGSISGFCNFLKKAYHEYRKDEDERKMSEISKMLRMPCPEK